jgi:hypothetical protein
MIDYGLSKGQFKQLNRYSHIFGKDHDQFVLNCILVVLDIWGKSEDFWMRIDPDISETDYSIDLPIDVEFELDDLSGEYDLPMSETINGVIGLVLTYLDESWSDKSGLEFDNMSDSEKLDQITRTNTNDESRWSNLFGGE